MTRVLVLSPLHLAGYRDLVVADSRSRGENPITVLPFADRRS